MIYKLTVYLDVHGEAFDPNLMPEAVERVFRPYLEKIIKNNADFPYSSDDTFDNKGEMIAKATKAKKVSIDFITKSQILNKMGK